MLMNREACYRALSARDRRFDGAFFVGVSSTGIYCRPICPANLPGEGRCTFYATAEDASAAGYRPCLRCRPELAPGTASVDAIRQLASKIAKHATDGSVAETTVADLAAELGISTRHLGRVFESEFGISPTAFAQTLRLVNATRLLRETARPIGEIAFDSGYASLRRFNAAFQSRYGASPTAFREGGYAPHYDAIVFDLPYNPPFDWRALLTFIGYRAIAGVEEICGARYARSAEVSGHTGWFSAEPSLNENALRITVSSSLAPVLPAVVARVRHLFDLGAKPAYIATVLGPLAAENPGFRVPGAFDGFEMALRAILGQQVTVRAARTLGGRFAARFGKEVTTPFEEITRTSPDASEIALASVDEIASLGLPGARAASIIALAQAVTRGEIRLEPGVNVAETMSALKRLPGIGEWTAQYVAMRALAWPDAFPNGDLGILKALGAADPKVALARSEEWRPWRAYAAIHLWHSLTSSSTEKEQ